MTNEYIKSLYETYGVEPKRYYHCTKHMPKHTTVCWDSARQKGGYCKNWDYENNLCEFYKEDEERRFYPPLTADKVIALEEVVISVFTCFKPSKSALGGYRYSAEIFFTNFYETRHEALANLLIKLYEHFDEQEIKQIREVLRG